ncbi:MAG: MoaD/ThiS family protein [Flavobacteriales bacterium]|nr:MoaD/ThiS family protein [Flavobacteriales bacterium]
MAKIIIPTPLRKFTNSEAKFSTDASTVKEAIDQLVAQHNGLKTHLLDEQGELRSFVRVYLEDEDINALEKGNTSVQTNSTLSIIPAIAGGNFES